MSDKTDQELIAAARAETNTCVCGDCLTRVTHRGYLLADALEQANAEIAELKRQYGGFDTQYEFMRKRINEQSDEIARLRAALPSPELLLEAAPCRHLDVDAICDECKVFLSAAARIEEVMR